MPGVLEGAECYKRSFQFGRAPGMDGMGVWQVATRPLCVRMASNFFQGAKEGKSPRRALHKCTVKCMLLQKGAVNYCGCISRIEGAYIRIVGASAPTKIYKITPLGSTMTAAPVRSPQLKVPGLAVQSNFRRLPPAPSMEGMVS